MSDCKLNEINGIPVDVISIGECIAGAAYAKWPAGFDDDFCLQSTSAGLIVFGEANRVIFDVMSGEWRLDLEHCTMAFVNAWVDLYGGITNRQKCSYCN